MSRPSGKRRWTIRSPDADGAGRQGLLALAVTAVAAVVAVTCTSAGERPPATAPATPVVAHEPPATTVLAPASAVPPADPTVAPAPAESAARPADTPAFSGPLRRFFGALAELDADKRAHHVRIAWLGDSHAAADYWTGAARDLLQKRFGDGGPGYVNVGYKGSRHDGIGIDFTGKWAVRPKAPSTTKPTADGIFGLGGVLARPTADSPRATLGMTGASGKLVWDVCTKLGAHDELRVALDGAGPVLLRANGDGEALSHHRVSSTSPTSLALVPTAGEPQLCGVVVERDESERRGLVLDQLGINGGRFGTALAWNEPAWGAELARRSPELVVLAYGTNEASDLAVDPRSVGRQAERLLARVRRVAPQADCALVAPTDRADRTDQMGGVVGALRERAAAAGCWFFDSYEAMGGKGSIVAWQGENPPRAARDGIHLTAKGYKELGQRLARALLDEYGRQAPPRRPVADPPAPPPSGAP